MNEDKKDIFAEEEDEFEQMMRQRIESNFSGAESKPKVSDARLEEMSKKLPSWSLEPPYSFLN